MNVKFNSLEKRQFYIVTNISRGVYKHHFSIKNMNIFNPYYSVF